MRAGLAFVFLGAIFSFSDARAQECRTPSDLLVDALAPPLLLSKEGSGGVALSWESTDAGAYLVHVGRLSTLRVSEHDHGALLSAVEAAAVLPELRSGSYLLVQSVCDDQDSSLGTGSDLSERPPGQVLDVTVGLEGTSVFGFQFTLRVPEGHPARESRSSLVGPFSEGASGSPMGDVFAPGPMQFNVLGSFGEFDPDPSLDLPVGTPQAVVRLAVGLSGALPELSDFELVDCRIRDARSEAVTDADCILLGAVPR